MTVDATPQRTWRFPRLLLEDHLALTLLSWAGLIIGVAALVTVVSITRDIVISSGWDVASGAIPWFAAFIGGRMLYTSLPLHVAHGRTRRDFAIEALIFGVIFTTVLALLTTAGFALEQGLYALADWSRGTPDDHLFSTYTAYGTIFAEYWLTVLVWTAAGGLIGAAVYRNAESGWLSLIPALVLISLAGLATEPRFGPLTFLKEQLSINSDPSLPVAVIVCLGCALAALAMIWPIVRNMPIRNK